MTVVYKTDTVIYETDPAEPFRVEAWSEYDQRWNEWDYKTYKTAGDAIEVAKNAKKTFPSLRLQVIEKG